MNIDRDVRVQGPVQISGANGRQLNLIPSNAVAVVIANTVIYTVPTLIYVGVTGDVAVIPYDSPDSATADPTAYIVFKSVNAGTFLPVYVRRIGAVGSGTTATDLVACF